MTIYKSTVEKILHELEHRDEVMARLGINSDMYYAYMVGRMQPILEALVNAENLKIGG